MDKLNKVVDVTYDDRGRRQFTLKETSKQSKPPAPPTATIAIDYSKPLQARMEVVDLEAKLGRRKLASDEDCLQAAPFKCSTCDFAVMDSNSWLDHLNSVSHNRMVGNHMKVEKVSVSRVRERIQLLKARKQAKDTNLLTTKSNEYDGGNSEEGKISKRPRH